SIFAMSSSAPVLASTRITCFGSITTELAFIHSFLDGSPDRLETKYSSFSVSGRPFSSMIAHVSTEADRNASGGKFTTSLSRLCAQNEDRTFQYLSFRRIVFGQTRPMYAPFFPIFWESMMNIDTKLSFDVFLSLSATFEAVDPR